MSSAGDAHSIAAEVAALSSGQRVDGKQVPRVDFKHGNVPPLPTGTVPSVGADQKASALALNDAGFKADADTNAATREVQDAVVNGTTTVTSATAAFVSGDVGARVWLIGCGVGGADLVARVASVTNGTTVVLDTAATASGSTKTLVVESAPNGSFSPVAGSTPRLGSTVALHS